jgi:hypothetical protein
MAGPSTAIAERRDAPLERIVSLAISPTRLVAAEASPLGAVDVNDSSVGPSM